MRVSILAVGFVFVYLTRGVSVQALKRAHEQEVTRHAHELAVRSLSFHRFVVVRGIVSDC